MEFLAGHSSDLSRAELSQLFKYRYDVFIEKLGWELKTEYGREADQFDHDNTVYVIAKNNTDGVSGCARLLPTTLPYLLEEVFPQLLNGMPPPKADDVWELSRFTTLDLNENEMPNRRQLSSETTAELLKKTIQCAKEQGAKRIISVTVVGVERLIRALGYKAHRAGPPMIIDGYPLIACWIDL